MARTPVNQPYSTAQSIPFGEPDSAAKYGKHAGIDYALPVGREVFAPASGSITSYIFGTYHGKVVEIYTGKEFVHMLHNSTLKFSPGQKVTEGEVVALSGSTGQGVTGPHVHFGVSKVPLAQVTKFADFIDPNEWLKGGPMATITKEQEQVMSILATGSVPGKAYGYPWVGKETTQANIDGLLNFWLGYSKSNGLIKNQSAQYVEVTEKLYRKK